MQGWESKSTTVNIAQIDSFCTKALPSRLIIADHFQKYLPVTTEIWHDSVHVVIKWDVRQKRWSTCSEYIYRGCSKINRVLLHLSLSSLVGSDYSS